MSSELMRDCRTIWRYTGSESVSGMRKLSPLTSAADVSSCLCLSLTGTCFTLSQRGNKLSKSVLMSILSGFFSYVLLFDYHPMKKIRAHIVWKVLKVKMIKISLLFYFSGSNMESVIKPSCPGLWMKHVKIWLKSSTHVYCLIFYWTWK